ncbi:MAG TPA: hypothetical protein VFF27_08885 [Bacteroidia bacterium]|jgi:hypothetical protein|nr:hypothetical protein [Bacteroidia bacterium]
MKTRRTIMCGMVVMTVLGFVACQKQGEKPVSIAKEIGNETVSPETAGGSGTPSGTHYELNIIGVPKGKSADMTSPGHRIFVSLTGNTKIMLNQGSDFVVLDGNGTDGTASFQLPNPDPTNSGTTRYSVYARAVGKPGGTASMSTCATDPLTGTVVCSNLTYVAVKGTKFQNVSAELLYIYADLDNDGTAERYPLFDSRLQDYFWNYDNNGLKVLQLRFYYQSTTVH